MLDQSESPDRANAPTSVYRYYDTQGILIYVGITSRGAARNAEHNQSQPWWKYVARQEVEHFPHRQHALQVEKHLIRTHRPPFNKQHNPDKGELAATYIRLRSEEVPRRSPGVVLKENGGRLPMEIVSFDGLFMVCRARGSDVTLASRIIFELSGFNAFHAVGYKGFITEWRRDGFLMGMTLKGRWLSNVTGVRAQIGKKSQGYFVRNLELHMGDKWVIAKPIPQSKPADDQNASAVSNAEG